MIYSALKDLRAPQASERLSARRYLLDLLNWGKKDYFLSIKQCCLTLNIPYERVITVAAIVDEINRKEDKGGKRENLLSSFDIIKETVAGQMGFVVVLEEKPKRPVGRPRKS
jgi:hypothetical protein